MLVSVFVLFSLAALLAPWTQNIRGRGRVLAYAPDQRQQPIEATISGRVEKWFVQEGTQVKKGDPIVELTDNDESMLERLGAERAAIEVRRIAQAQRSETLERRIESVRRSQRAETPRPKPTSRSRSEASRLPSRTSAPRPRSSKPTSSTCVVSGICSKMASRRERELELAELATRQSRAKVASAQGEG